MEVSYESVIGKTEREFISHGAIAEILVSQKVLITGAGGSVGSKIALTLSKLPDLEILATDRDENRLHSLSLEMAGSALFDSSNYRLLDIRDCHGVEKMINEYKPTIVIHAAALKHLAILEKQPREAYITNFLGTRNVLTSAANIGVKRFLNISTDKAADPVSILGKTKFMAEVLTADFRRKGFSKYTSVRFGNVFNSKGSVIETFTHQIKHGIPVTLTDPEVSRFFMKIEEAANLCLAAVVLNEGDVYVIDMGEPIKILDVINKLMQILDNKSEIQIVGLRKGEKLKEQLWSSQEIVCPTKMKEVKALNLVVSRLPLNEFAQQPGSNERAIAEIDRFIKGCNVRM